MEVFDGFIAAVAAEIKIKFHKNGDGAYTTKIEFEDDTEQDVLISLAYDESGDRLICFYAPVCSLKTDSVELYKYALQVNRSLDYGALCIFDEKLVLKNSIMLEECQPLRFVKNLTYVAAKSTEIAENLLDQNNVD